MARARRRVAWLGLAAVGLAELAAPGGAWAASAKFLTYANEAECAAGKVLAAATCRVAFANARAEFDRKTRALPPRGRPSFTGADIVETPRESTVTPLSSGPRTLGFAPQPLTRPAVEPLRPTHHPRAVAGRTGVVRPAEPDPEADEGPVSAPRGSGFSVKDGVLTYPAPERYRHLPQR